MINWNGLFNGIKFTIISWKKICEKKPTGEFQSLSFRSIFFSFLSKSIPPNEVLMIGSSFLLNPAICMYSEYQNGREFNGEGNLHEFELSGSEIFYANDVSGHSWTNNHKFVKSDKILI